MEDLAAQRKQPSLFLEKKQFFYPKKVTFALRNHTIDKSSRFRTPIDKNG